MNKKRSVVLASVAVLGLVWAPLVGAAIYLKIDGVDGEASDKDHKGWIIIESMSSSVHISPSATRSSGGTTQRGGDTLVEEISVTKSADKSSPYLAQAVCKGEHIPKVEIHVTSTYGGALYRYEMRDVRVTSYSVSAAGSAGDVPTETFTLNYGEVKVTYDAATGKGKPRGNVESTWKVEQGEK